MFTTEGNIKVQSTIDKARRGDWTWVKTKKNLKN
jgi:hypothetical protein